MLIDKNKKNLNHKNTKLFPINDTKTPLIICHIIRQVDIYRNNLKNRLLGCVKAAEKPILEVVSVYQGFLEADLGKEKLMGGKKTVVIIDDDEDLLRLLTYEFHQLGFEVKSFTRGKEGNDFLLEEKNLEGVFLIILDRLLPDMDGLDILRAFQKKFPGKIPCLILSILSTEKDIVGGLQVGAVDYIPKPFSVFMLMQKAMNLMKTLSQK